MGAGWCSIWGAGTARAEPVRDSGLTYLGLDVDPAGLASLERRGFETAIIDLELPEAELTARLQEILGGRELGFVVMLDVLEHLVAGGLRRRWPLAARRLERRAVLSVPNVTHVDIIGKALLGRWDRTDIGLLDRTHLQLFGERSAVQPATDLGWKPVDADDVLARSPSSTPADAPHLRPGAPLHDLLGRSVAGPTATATPTSSSVATVGGPAAAGGWLRRPGALVAVVLAGPAVPDPALLDDLRGQVDRDFAVVVGNDRPVALQARRSRRRHVDGAGRPPLAPAPATSWWPRPDPSLPGSARAAGRRRPGRGSWPGAPTAPSRVLACRSPRSSCWAPPPRADRAVGLPPPPGALVDGGLGPLGPTGGPVATIARCAMWCGRYDSPVVSMATRGRVPRMCPPRWMAVLDKDPSTATRAAAPSPRPRAGARRGRGDDLQLRREQHERYAEAARSLSSMPGSRAVHPVGCPRFAAVRGPSPPRRQIHLRSRRLDGGIVKLIIQIPCLNEEDQLPISIGGAPARRWRASTSSSG